MVHRPFSKFSAVFTHSIRPLSPQGSLEDIVEARLSNMSATPCIDVSQYSQYSHRAEMSAGEFQYRPLKRDDEEDYRLLNLYPGDFEDPVRCEIFHAGVESGIEYEALSYTWALEDGDARLSHIIICSYAGEEETFPLRITANCNAALRRLRNKNYTIPYWIDAICIDQTNQQERNHQVKLMSDIYFNASHVLVYLGEEDLGFGSPSLWLDAPKRLSALQKLFSKRWSSRVWVIQEVALAQNISMMTGDATVRLDTNLLARIRGRARAYGLVVPGPLAREANVATRDLLTMLNVSRNCLSTDPRDKVYGLMGFVSDDIRDLINIDYSQRIETVLTNAAAAIIISRKDLDILSYASTSLGSRHVAGRLPTWVPDWTKNRHDSIVTPQFQNDSIVPWSSLDRSSFLIREPPEYWKHMDWKTVIHIPPTWSTEHQSRPSIRVRAHCIGVVDDLNWAFQSQSSNVSNVKTLRRHVMDLLQHNQTPTTWPPELQWLLRYTTEDLSDKRWRFDREDVASFCVRLERADEKKVVFRAGHLPAIAEPTFHEGDTVWAVDGCRTPLILQSVDKHGFQIVGNCELIGLRHIDCWTYSKENDQNSWLFDPFRPLAASDTQIIEIY